MGEIYPGRLGEAMAAERQSYYDAHPRTRAVVAAGTHLLTGVPMTWMAKVGGRLPTRA